MLRRIRFLTAGESHGKALVCILEGLPAGLSLSVDDINVDLKRRQGGYGRGGRMKIEQDRVEILSGIRWGKTIGSPIAFLLHNKDWGNWSEGMSSEKSFEGSIPMVTRPRPGHADLAGIVKHRLDDARDVLERSSARETAMRVAAGAAAKKLLSEFGISVYSYVLSVGDVYIDDSFLFSTDADFKSLYSSSEESMLRCPDKDASLRMKAAIDTASSEGDTLGGTFAVVATGNPIGLGDYIQWDLRLDARLSYALSSIQAIKAVEIGRGYSMSTRRGSQVMDEIYYSSKLKYYRTTNNAGGIEGGMTNGMPVILKAAMKPIPTLKRPLSSVDIKTKESIKAAYERSDVCAVPAASVIGEAMASLTIADAFLEKFGSDSIEEIRTNYRSYVQYMESC